MVKIGLLNGPNLDRLGKREPEIYGIETLAGIEEHLISVMNGLGELFTYHSNHEGNFIDKIHEWSDSGFAGLIINPGGFTTQALHSEMLLSPQTFQLLKFTFQTFILAKTLGTNR